MLDSKQVRYSFTNDYSGPNPFASVQLRYDDGEGDRTIGQVNCKAVDGRIVLYVVNIPSGVVLRAVDALTGRDLDVNPDGSPIVGRNVESSKTHVEQFDELFT